MYNKIKGKAIKIKSFKDLRFYDVTNMQNNVLFLYRTNNVIKP